MRKLLTLADVMEHHAPYAHRLAEQHDLGPLSSRGVEGDPRDAVRTARLTYRFERGIITYNARTGVDYHIERTTPA